MTSRFLTSKQYRFGYMAKLGFYNRISDEKYLKRKYERYLNRKLSFENPDNFNEKLQWLKLYDRRTVYTVMVDKVKVREYIAEKIGEEYLIPLIGVWDTPKQIDFALLPEQFAMKCNHNSGLGMCICTDKSKLNIKAVQKKLNQGLKENYFLVGREWPYKDVPPKIIVEKYMKSDEGGLTDYKIHCFNGEPKLILVCKDRFAEEGLTEDFFTPQWEHLNIRRPDHPNAKIPIIKPDKLQDMLDLAAQLSKDIPFLRVDFYIVENRIYFSELTFYPASGFVGFIPEEWDKTLGDWLKLPID